MATLKEKKSPSIRIRVRSAPGSRLPAGARWATGRAQAARGDTAWHPGTPGGGKDEARRWGAPSLRVPAPVPWAGSHHVGFSTTLPHQGATSAPCSASSGPAVPLPSCHPLPEFSEGSMRGEGEGAPLALWSGDSSLWPGHQLGRRHPSCHPGSPPLGHIPGRLQEPRVVVLLQDVLRLVDEDRRALETLPAVGDLLGQLPQLHHLRREQGEAKMLRARHAEGGC